MAAPMESIAGELKVECNENIPDELNLASPNLDPFKVLYSENVYLPHKNPTAFNNLAEFESIVIRGNVPSENRGRGRTRRDDQRRSRLSALRVQVNTEESDTSENDEAKIKQMERRKKMNRNVLNRMSSFEKGPMTILRKAVEEKIKVKVWTRSAVTRRGYCIAYIIAFDKHFNLALMDVDETYRIPKVIRKPILEEAKTKKVEEEKKSSEQSIGDDQRLPGFHGSDIYTDKKTDDGNDTDSSVSKLTERLSIKHPSEAALSLKYSDELGTLAAKHANDTDQTSETINKSETSQDNMSEQEPINTPCLLSASETSESLRKNEESSDDTKFITEIQYKTKHRHVNQLFVRGDNVVSVTLLPMN